MSSLPVGYANILNQNIGNYYHHVLPGNMGRPGDRKVTWAQAGMNTPEYRKLERAHDTYLSSVAINLVILASVVAIATHFALIVTSKTKIEYSTLDDLASGPLLQIIIAGLVGVGLLLGHMGISENLYYALYIPFGIIVMGVGIWSIMDMSKVDPANLPSFSGVASFAPETLIWAGIAGIILISGVLQWMKGNMRLDALGSSTAGTLVFILTAALFSYGLSRVFALIIRTLDHYNVDKGNRNGVKFFLAYVFASLGMVLLVVASVKFLDTMLTFLGGHLHTVFAPPIGVGASKAIMETQRAFQMSIYSVVFISSALMWRYRNGLVSDKSNNEDVSAEWAGLASLVFFVPVVALVSEGVKKWVELYGPVYDLLRAIVLSCVLVYIGTGFIPWNYVTLGIASAIVVFASLRYLEVQEEWDKPFSALVCTSFFVLGKMAFRGSDLWLRVDGKPSKGKTQDVLEHDQVDTWKEWVSWGWWMLFPALLLTMISTSLSTMNYDVEYGGHLFRIYAAFVFFYSASLTFVDTSRDMPLNDSPYYDIVPENEAASLAIDGIVLMACLMITTACWQIIVPEELNRMDPTKQMVGYAIVGAACTYMYINVRHDHALSGFAREQQKQTEEWYIRMVQDAEAKDG